MPYTQRAVPHRAPRSSASRYRLSSILLHRTHGRGARGLFNGLRVRMGVATGEVAAGGGYVRVVGAAKGERPRV